MLVVYIGGADGCIVATQNGAVEVKKGESIDLCGVQLERALRQGFIEKYLYDEEMNDEN